MNTEQRISKFEGLRNEVDTQQYILGFEGLAAEHMMHDHFRLSLNMFTQEIEEGQLMEFLAWTDFKLQGYDFLLDGFTISKLPNLDQHLELVHQMDLESNYSRVLYERLLHHRGMPACEIDTHPPALGDISDELHGVPTQTIIEIAEKWERIAKSNDEQLRSITDKGLPVTPENLPNLSKLPPVIEYWDSIDDYTPDDDMTMESEQGAASVEERFQMFLKGFDILKELNLIPLDYIDSVDWLQESRKGFTSFTPMLLDRFLEDATLAILVFGYCDAFGIDNFKSNPDVTANLKGAAPQMKYEGNQDIDYIHLAHEVQKKRIN